MPIPGDVLTATVDPTGTGGIIVAAEDSPAGSLIDGPGQLQFGPILVKNFTGLMWGEITNWRGISTDYNDAALPASHGDRAGSILAQGIIVTFDAQLNVGVDDRATALATVEYYTRIQDVEIPLVANDGAGTEFRMARVVARELPDTILARLGYDMVTVQFKCADPRRYALESNSARLDAPSSSGGLDYPLHYTPGLNYGTVVSGSASLTNGGNVDTPLSAVIRGPITDPIITIAGRRFAFDITLVAGDTLTIDGRMGSVLLNDVSDRSQNLTDDSDLLDDFSLPPGISPAALTAAAGSGFATLSWHDARM